MNVLVNAVVPVGFIILIGFIAGRILPIERHPLAQLTLYIFVPALVADSLYRTNLSVSTTTNLLVGFVITSAILYLLSWGWNLIFKFPLSLQKSVMATTLFPNNGNMGLPLIAFALGTPGLERAVVYMIASSILMFGFGPALLEGKEIISGIRLTLKLPLIWAMLGGLCLRLLTIQLPFQLDRSIHLLGQASIPIALIILGMQLADTPLKVGVTEMIASGVRLAVAPLIACGVGYALHLEDLDLQVLVLQSGMPAAVNSFVLVTEFGGDAPWVARTIVISTLISFITIPVLLWASNLI